MRGRGQRGRGFTLIEILAAIVVLTILAAMIVQIMSGATKAVSLNGDRMDVEGQVRMAFAAMGNDFAQMVRRPDADAVFSKRPGNDCMFFYSETTGFFDSTVAASAQSPFSVVGYFIDNSFHLERFAKGLTWDDAAGGGPVFLTYSESATPVPGSTLATKWAAEIPAAGAAPAVTANCQVVGDEVFRMEFCFLRTDGTISDVPYISDPSRANGLQDVSAVIVSLALLDGNSRKMAPGGLAAAAAALADSALSSPGSSQPTLMATRWTQAINGSEFASAAGLPQKAAAGVKVYQHLFYLNRN